jgi:hypothetical protein
MGLEKESRGREMNGSESDMQRANRELKSDVKESIMH